jgi:hypothetical protein
MTGAPRADTIVRPALSRRAFLRRAASGAQVHGQWPGLSPGALVDGDLAATTEYRTILAEILEKRCGAGSVGSIFPGIGSQRLGVVNAR